MSQPRILIVDANSARSQVVRDAIFRASLPAPISREDGESAVMWVGLNPCDLVIISYELPDMDGLELLAKLRSRKPNLPAIMFSDSDSQAVAIAAFRSGVLDFTPATGDFANIIANVAYRGLIEASSGNGVDASIYQDPTLSKIPPDRLEPTYQNRLRTIGRQLEVYHYSSIMLMEVEGGFLVRAYHEGSRRPQALEFPDKDLPRLVQIAIEADKDKRVSNSKVSSLVPTGYEDLLRAIGYKLDTSNAEAISISELKEMIIVAGRWHSEASTAPVIEPFHMFLREFEVDHLLNQAFNRRGRSGSRQGNEKTKAGRSLRDILRRLD